MYNSSNILSIYDQKPQVFNHTAVQLFDTSSFDASRGLDRNLSANLSIKSLLDRNLGRLDINPIDDYFYEEMIIFSSWIRISQAALCDLNLRLLLEHLNLAWSFSF